MKLDKNLPFLGTLLKKEQDLVAYADQLAGGSQLAVAEAAMFVPFLYELRARKVPVGHQEAVDARARR